ncbi:sulfite exporter TauE/SafE family protein [Occultella gossypii]|uniref:Probable membrane transporter protein n=1 Tax=Occultella gossypii TaxID=2800820 RepID=A0ABS7SFX7_9MICO|nr:sulfite exporter TauE/SafE family protein [Occultella gossypii]MBZ2198669.1 sulfite exporter TauE/SafE family protein [Occultella gossypii]
MSALTDFTALAWALLVVGALIVGLSKAALPGANTITIAIFAALLPARESTAVLLILLIVGDVFAVWAYRKHADWPTLRRLVPTVLVGVALGVVFLALADDAWVRRVIAVILLLVIGVTLLRRAVGRRAEIRAAALSATSDAELVAAGGEAASGGEVDGAGGQVAPQPSVAGSRQLARRVQTGIYGTLGGFTTMVANAGGPVMSMYFIASRFSVKRFLGTSAWFFAIVNVTKVPFQAGLGLITVPGLLLNLVLIPAVIAGAFFGRWLAPRIDQALFERLVIVLTVVGALYLLI